MSAAARRPGRAAGKIYEPKHSGDEIEAVAVARHGVLRAVRWRTGHILRALDVARTAEVWSRVRELADDLSATACAGELLEAEVAGDEVRTAELQALVRRRGRAA